MPSVLAQTSQFVHSISTDMLIIIAALIALFCYGLYQGTPKLGGILVSIYVATVLYMFFPYADTIILGSTALNHTIWWIIFFTITKIIIDRIVIIPTAFSTMRNWIEIGLLSLVIFASMVTILYTVLSFNAFYSPSLVSLSVLASSIHLFWVLVASLVVLLGIVFI